MKNKKISKLNWTQQEISDITGFDQGDEWDSEESIRKYFTLETMKSLYWNKNVFQKEWEDITQEDLDNMADCVIENKWHMVDLTEMTLADLYTDFPCEEKSEEEIQEYEEAEEFKNMPAYVVVSSKDHDLVAIFRNNGACPLKNDWNPNEIIVCTLEPNSDWPEVPNLETLAFYGKETKEMGFADFVGVYSTPWGEEREMARRRKAAQRRTERENIS